MAKAISTGTVPYERAGHDDRLLRGIAGGEALERDLDVGFCELSARIGQKKSFQVVRKVSIASTAIAGRTAGTTT